LPSSERRSPQDIARCAELEFDAPDLPARYPRLSTTLTAGACVSLAIALEQALRM